jgi:hypothetical protein
MRYADEVLGKVDSGAKIVPLMNPIEEGEDQPADV